MRYGQRHLMLAADQLALIVRIGGNDAEIAQRLAALREAGEFYEKELAAAKSGSFVGVRPERVS